ncbi:class I SAM-dependent methyltransferase [Nostoc sp.]
MKIKPATSLLRKLLIILTTGFPDQKFIGAFYIPFLFQLVPWNYRKSLALNLIAISPHYFGHFYPTNQIPSRSAFLETEHQRLASSRQHLIDTKVKPYVTPDMTVLDHGCGPGYLANAVSPYCIQVIAVDISSGVIACAKAINAQPNITYLTETGNTLTKLERSSINLIYSFAVMLHVKDEVCQALLKEFFQLLKPQGKVICEFVVAEDLAVDPLKEANSIFNNVKDKYTLWVVGRPLEQIKQFIQDAGFELLALRENEPEEKNGYYTFVFSKPSVQFSTSQQVI